MNRCNVDIFDYQLNYVHHDTIEIPNIDMDYLTPEASSFLITETNAIPEKGVVVISGGIDYVGVIDSVESENYQTRVSIKPFITYFDQEILFDVRTQYSKRRVGVPLETTLKNLIYQYWGTGTQGSYTVSAGSITRKQNDTLQELPIGTITTPTSTTDWTFGIKISEPGSKYNIVEFMSTILQEAIYKYRVVVEPTINFSTMKVDLVISAPTEEVKIDADLRGVKINAFTINYLSSEVNKLEMWNSEALRSNPQLTPSSSNPIYYYLHNDGTYTTSDTDRIQPVMLQVELLNPEEDEDGNQLTFAETCEEHAKEIFGEPQWTNYIELEFGNYDTLVDIKSIKIGQKVQVLHNGEWHETILTGKKLSTTTTLLLGTVRVDLTKKAKLNSK